MSDFRAPLYDLIWLSMQFAMLGHLVWSGEDEQQIKNAKDEIDTSLRRISLRQKPPLQPL